MRLSASRQTVLPTILARIRVGSQQFSLEPHQVCRCLLLCRTPFRSLPKPARAARFILRIPMVICYPLALPSCRRTPCSSPSSYPPRPAFRLGLVESLVKPACRRVPVMGPLAVGIGVVDREAEAYTLARGATASSANHRQSHQTQRGNAGRCADAE
jgi:hypothetical protein